MKITFYVSLLCFAAFFYTPSMAQKTVVIMGSSTAAGNGATSYATSWAGRLKSSYNINTTDGIDTTFYNIALAGYTTYDEMYTSFIPPGGRPAPDPLHNVTKALSYSPDIVIINLPSNDVGAGFSITETMNNFRLMYNAVNASGAKCFITTTQPRNDYTLFQRQTLSDMKDSILAQFGLFSINFWDQLVTSDGLNMLRSDRQDPTTMIHPNDIGHQYLFDSIQAKKIFSIIVLPLQLTSFDGRLNNNVTYLNWHAEQLEANTIFTVERSADGEKFTPLFSTTVTVATTSANFSWTDKNTLSGKSFYRLKITEAGGSNYSGTVSIVNNSGALKISRIATSSNSSTVMADISNTKNEPALISIINAAGVVIKKTKQNLMAPSTSISLSIPHFAAGTYFLKVTTSNGAGAIKGFIK